MPVSRRAWTLFALIVLLFVAMPSTAGEGRVKLKDSAIPFVSDLEQALETAKAGEKPVYLAFGATWCPVCRQLKEKTLLEPPMQALADGFVWVFIDIDRNITLARTWGVKAVPTIFLLDPAGNARRKIIGGAEADQLAATLKEFLDDLDTETAAGEPVPVQTFRNSALTETPSGFRGKSVCFSNVGYGPLSVRSQSPFQSLRLGILPRTPSTLARGEHQVRVGATWVNQWANDGGRFDPANGVLGPYVLDYESLDANIASFDNSPDFGVHAAFTQRF